MAKGPKEVSWLQRAVVNWIRQSSDLMLIDYEAKLIGPKDPSKTNVSKPGIDILCLARNGDLVVFELKRGSAGSAALSQAFVYAKSVSLWDEQHLARQRARKQSFSLDVDKVRAKIAEYLGGAKLSGRAQIHIVAKCFDPGIVERARERHGSIEQVKLFRFEQRGDAAEFKVELTEQALPTKGSESGGATGPLLVDVAVSPLRHDEKFKTWCKRLPKDQTGLGEFFRAHLLVGSENNSAKHGGQLYFHYKYNQRDDAWTWVYHVTFQTKGPAKVGRRAGFEDVRKLEGGEPSGGWIKKTMGLEELNDYFPTDKEGQVGWRR